MAGEEQTEGERHTIMHGTDTAHHSPNPILTMELFEILLMLWSVQYCASVSTPLPILQTRRRLGLRL
jgi:hypothetical protein